MDIHTYRRDPNQQKNYSEESSNLFCKPQEVITERGIDLITEQDGARGVEIRISLSHVDIFNLLIKSADLSPDTIGRISNGVSGYINYISTAKAMKENQT